MKQSTQSPSATRSILADGEPAVRNALATLMTQGLGMQVVAEADTGEALLRLARRHRPDLAVVAWNLVAPHGGAALAALHEAAPGLRVVVLGLRPETRAAALAAGADGFISKVDAPEVVVGVLEHLGRDAASPGAVRGVDPRGIAGHATVEEG
jgi:DNA-binding NarL/FixJ family response regulator